MTTAVASDNCVPSVGLSPVVRASLAALAIRYGMTIAGIGIKDDGGVTFDLAGVDVCAAGRFGAAAAALLKETRT